MPTLTAPKTLSDIVKREFDPDYTRETVTLAAGPALVAGAVLGRDATTGTYAPSPATGSGGVEVACAVLLTDAAASANARTALALVRGPAIVADAALTFDASVDDDAKRAIKRAQLAAHGIVARFAI